MMATRPGAHLLAEGLTEIHSAQHVGKVFGAIPSNFLWANFFISLVCQWAQFTWFGPLLLATQGGQIADGSCLSQLEINNGIAILVI